MTLQPPAAPAPAAGAPVRPAPLRLWLGGVLAALSGRAMPAASPPYGLWWLAPVSVALLAAAAHRRRLRSGAGVGMIAGLVFFVPLLAWTHIVAGWPPWALLSTAQAAYLAL